MDLLTSVADISLVSGQVFQVPLWKVLILVFFSIWAIFFGKFKMGLILVYFCILNLTLLEHRAFWIDTFGGQFMGIFIYSMICLVSLGAGVRGCFRQSH